MVFTTVTIYHLFSDTMYLKGNKNKYLTVTKTTSQHCTTLKIKMNTWVLPSAFTSITTFPLLSISNSVSSLLGCSMMASFKIALSKSKCGYCKKELTNPRLLPCSHASCYQCLVDSCCASDDPKNITCPICKRPAPLPAFGIMELPSMKSSEDKVSFYICIFLRLLIDCFILVGSAMFWCNS